ncbi:hypothetical protein GCM10029992_35720 [Glycomyces albus]
MFIRESTIKAAKAAVFALVCVPAAAAAHMLAGGAAVPGPVLLAAMPIAAAVYLLAKLGPRDAVWLSTVFAVTQALLHSLFALSANGHAAHDPHEAAAMTLLHTASTAVTVLWVARIEPGLPACAIGSHARPPGSSSTGCRLSLGRFRPARPRCPHRLRRSGPGPAHGRWACAGRRRGEAPRPPPTSAAPSESRSTQKAGFTMPRNRIGRALARTAVIGSAVAATLAISGPAAAHVTVSTDNTVAGTYTLLTVAVPHGCDGEPTTAIAIQIPEPINAVTPSANPNWSVEKVMTDLPEPVVDVHGNEVTERVGEVVYTATTPLPDDLRDAFELSLRLPEETAGQTLHFPVVQTCTNTDHPWVEIAEEGQDSDELESPHRSSRSSPPTRPTRRPKTAPRATPQEPKTGLPTPRPHRRTMARTRSRTSPWSSA